MHSGFSWGKAEQVLALSDIADDSVTAGKRPPRLYAYEWGILADAVPESPPWRIALNLHAMRSLLR